MTPSPSHDSAPPTSAWISRWIQALKNEDTVGLHHLMSTPIFNAYTTLHGDILGRQAVLEASHDPSLCIPAMEWDASDPFEDLGKVLIRCLDQSRSPALRQMVLNPSPNETSLLSNARHFFWEGSNFLPLWHEWITSKPKSPSTVSDCRYRDLPWSETLIQDLLAYPHGCVMVWFKGLTDPAAQHAWKSAFQSFTPVDQQKVWVKALHVYLHEDHHDSWEAWKTFSDFREARAVFNTQQWQDCVECLQRDPHHPVALDLIQQWARQDPVVTAQWVRDLEKTSSAHHQNQSSHTSSNTWLHAIRQWARRLQRRVSSEAGVWQTLPESLLQYQTVRALLLHSQAAPKHHADSTHSPAQPSARP